MNWFKTMAAGVAALCLGGCVGYGFPGTGYPDSGYGYPDSGYGYPDYGNPGYGNGYGYGSNGTVRCESNDNRTRRCNVDTRGGVRLTRQLSDARCIQGRNWGYDRSGIWVSQGCRAEFTIGHGGGYGSGYGPGQGYGQVLRCESENNRQRRCNANVRRGVELVRQLSDTRCVQGQNWGWDRGGIWVTGGCRGEFRAY